MNSDRYKMFFEGRSFWHKYLELNGYAFEPKEDGLKKLSSKLGIKKSYIRKCINVFLEY